MTQNELIDGLEADLRRLLTHARAHVAPRTSHDLQHRPAPERWNTAESLAHLNAFWADYLPAIERAIHKGKARKWTPNGPVRYTARGKRALRRVDPAQPKAFKTAKRYNFFQKSIEPDPLKSFIIGAEKLQRLLLAARAVDLNKTTVPKAHAWVGQYSLGNLLEWLVKHAQKHLGAFG